MAIKHIRTGREVNAKHMLSIYWERQFDRDSIRCGPVCGKITKSAPTLGELYVVEEFYRKSLAKADRVVESVEYYTRTDS
jgi:hypothetical protein